MFKRRLYVVILLAVCGVLLSCTNAGKEVQLGKEFTLDISQTVTLKGENLSVKFEQVVEDSRCQRGVTCVWEGRVSCMLRFITDGNSSSVVVSQPGLSADYAKASYQGYQLTFKVEPYPEAGEKIKQDDYRLLLTVSK